MSATKQHRDGEKASEQSNDQQLAYQCPFCDTQYSHEILTRVHVERSEDTAHINQKGSMPETKIKVVNEDGEVVDTLSKRPQDIDFRELTLDDIPDEYNDQHKCIILAGAYNPRESNYKALEKGEEKEDGVIGSNSIMEEHGLEKLSYSTVRRVIREFYRPEEVKAEKQSKNKSGDKSLSDLTLKQQAIVIAHLANPAEGKSKIADRAGDASNAYPSSVYDTAEEIINQISKEIQAGTPVRKAILAELDVDDIKALYERSLEAYENGDITLDQNEDGDDQQVKDLFNLGIKLKPALKAAAEDKETEEEGVFDMGVGEQRQALSASPYDTDTTEEAGSQETWSAAEAGAEATTDSTEQLDEMESPVEEIQPVGQGADTTTEDQPTEDTEDHTEVESGASTQSTEVSETTDEPVPEDVADAVDAVPREEVQELYEKVSFFVEVTDKEIESEAQSRQHAFAQKVEEKLEGILQPE